MTLCDRLLISAFDSIRRFPVMLLAVALALACVAALGLQHFSIDANAEALVLEDDSDLEFYDITRRDFKSDEFFIVSVTFAEETGDVFAPGNLRYIETLSERFAEIPGVVSVDSVLTVPLFRSPKPRDINEFRTMAGEITLLDPRVNVLMARDELLEHEVARDNLVSSDGRSANILVHIFDHEPARFLNEQRIDIRHRISTLRTLIKLRDERDADTVAERAQLAQLQAESAVLDDAYMVEYDYFSNRRREIFVQVRALVQSENAPTRTFHLSGLPTLANEMVEALTHDIIVFGSASLALLAVGLLLVFGRLRWVAIPILTSALVVVIVVGVMSWYRVRLTLATANVVSIAFIVSIAHSIHLVVRFRELQMQAAGQPSPALESRTLLVIGTLRSMWKPCLYTALTTSVGFASLVVSRIKPVMAFGTFMALGAMVALIVAFAMFPALVLLLGAPAPPRKNDFESRGWVLRAFATVTFHGRQVIPILGALLVAVSVVGITRITVETRLIDYFHANSDTYRGLAFIDQRMGGTTTIEVIFSADDDHFFHKTANLEKLDRVSKYLQSRRDIGSVISAYSFVEEISGKTAEPLLQKSAFRAILTPRHVREMVLEKAKPVVIPAYISPDGRRARLIARAYETQPGLDRDGLLRELREYIDNDPELAGMDVRVNGIFVLYTNMINSLIGSQVNSFSIVFFVVFLMLFVLFRSLDLALIGMLPNLVPVMVVLGVMGFFGIPLDIITVMIASVSLGIGVDGSIHYISRFRKEFVRDGDYRQALMRSHLSIGRAILYTSLAVIAGMAVMVLSRFVPTVYFGGFTALALAAALIGALTILPAFILILRPFSRRHSKTKTKAKAMNVTLAMAMALVMVGMGASAGCGAPPPVITPSGKLAAPQSFAGSRVGLDGLLGQPELDAAAVIDARAAMGQKLELTRLLALAATENPELRRLKAEILAAEGRENQAGALPNPTLELGARRIPTNPANSLGETDIQAVYRQPLALSGRLGSAQRAAQHDRERLEAVARAGARELMMAVQVAFVRYWRAVRCHELQRQIVEMRAQQVAFATREAAQGRLARLDVQRTMDWHARARLGLATATAALETTAAALRTAVGDAQLPLGNPPETWALPVPPTGMDRIRTRTWVLGHPLVVAADRQAVSARARAQIAGHSADDDVELRLGYEYEGRGNFHWLSARLLIPLPLFDRGAGAERAALADEAAAMAKRDRLIVELLAALDTVRAERQSALDRLQIFADQLIPSAHQRLDLVEQQFGTRTSTHDLLEAKIEAHQLELDAWELREAAAIATYRLRALLGE